MFKVLRMPNLPTFLVGGTTKVENRGQSIREDFMYYRLAETCQGWPPQSGASCGSWECNFCWISWDRGDNWRASPQSVLACAPSGDASSEISWGTDCNQTALRDPLLEGSEQTFRFRFLKSCWSDLSLFQSLLERHFVNLRLRETWRQSPTFFA